MPTKTKKIHDYRDSYLLEEEIRELIMDATQPAPEDEMTRARHRRPETSQQPPKRKPNLLEVLGKRVSQIEEIQQARKKPKPSETKIELPPQIIPVIIDIGESSTDSKKRNTLKIQIELNVKFTIDKPK